MSTTLPLSQVKARLSEMVDRVEQEHDRVVLTRNGAPAAVLVSTGDLEALEDTLDLLSDADALAEIRRGQAEIRDGAVVSAEALRSKFLPG